MNESICKLITRHGFLKLIIQNKHDVGTLFKSEKQLLNHKKIFKRS